MLRASVTVFYGLLFHEEGSDADFGDVIWGPIDRDEVHCTDEAAVSAGELLGATKPKVPYNNRDPKVFALYQAWWAEARRRLEASGCTFVRYGDMTNMTMVRWGVAVATSLHQTESFTFALALDAEKLVVQPTWNEMLRKFCDAVGIAWCEPQWHIGASD